MNATLDPSTFEGLVERALAEDIGAGDITTQGTVDPARPAKARLIAKSECVLCGLDVAQETFRRVDGSSRLTRIKQDGERCAPGTLAAEIVGTAAGLLTAERTALNFVQRLSGIATLTRRFVDAAGGRIAVLDTRKTTPTLRALEKYAVRCGGGRNHRVGLFDAVLIKENHARLAGGIGLAVERMRGVRPALAVEVEAQSLDEVEAALQAGADIILLDNLSTEDLHEAIRRIGGRAKTEVSGRVTLERMPELAASGADFVSVGALTHSAPAADLSLEIEPL